MATIGSVNTSAAQASQAVQAALAATANGANPAQGAPSGLPPVGLARAASLNTVNAELVSSQWGIDPASVAGVYGGAAETGLFSGDNLLPLLTTLTHANAEQALTLIGVQTPTPGGQGQAASSSAAYASGKASGSQTAAPPPASGSSAPMVVDPLWGRTA